LGIENKVSDFKPILQKITKNIESWKAKFFFHPGKPTLISSVCAPTAAYYMQCLPFPKTVCVSIDKAYKDFFWSNGRDMQKIHLIGWDKICLPKDLGGLGFHKSFEWNCALLLKLIWRPTLCPNTPWASIFLHRSLLSSYSNSIIGKCISIAKPLIDDSNSFLVMEKKLLFGMMLTVLLESLDQSFKALSLLILNI